MKPVALICAAAAVVLGHSARSPNVYEAVIKEQEDEREAARAKEQESKRELDQVMVGAGKLVGNGMAALSTSSKIYKPSKSVTADAPMPAAFQEMSGLVADMELDAKKGVVDPSVQAAVTAEKTKVSAPNKDSGMEFKVFEAETTLGESEQKRHTAHAGHDEAALSPIAAGQSWNSIKTEEKESAKSIMDPSKRVQNWENEMSQDLKDAANSMKQDSQERHEQNALAAAKKLGEVIAKGEQRVKQAPALLENPPKKKNLVAVDKNVHVNNGGHDVWPKIMPSMQVETEEPAKTAKGVAAGAVPFKKVAPAEATSPQSKAMTAEAKRALAEFHSDPMFQHLLGPSEDPELSAQTQQDLKMLHQALGKTPHFGPPKRPVAKSSSVKPPVKAPSAKPAPAVAKKIPQQVAPQAVPQKSLQAPVQKPAETNQVQPKPTAPRSVPKPAVPSVNNMIKPVPMRPRAAPPAANQHAKPVPPAHVAQKTAPKQVVAAHHSAPKQAPHPRAAPQKHHVPAQKAALRRPSPVPAKKVSEPQPRGAKLWSPEMDGKTLSREDSLEERVAEQAAETRAEMENELKEPDSEFPVPVALSHHSRSDHKLGVPEGSGTKTLPIEGAPSQGVQGQNVAHEDGKSMTKDWGDEYGMVKMPHDEQKAPPAPVKGAAAAFWTVPCFALAVFVLN